MSKTQKFADSKKPSLEDEDLLSVGSDGSEDDEVDEKQHSKLLNAITSLDGKKK